MEKELMEYMKDFQFIDFLAFGRYLEAEEREDFEGFIIEIIDNFSRRTKKDRKQILSLAKKISKKNTCAAKQKTEEVNNGDNENSR